MPKPQKIVLVCINERPPGHPKGSCCDVGAKDILAAFREERDKREVKGKLTVAGTSCLGPCHLGPVVAVLPDNVWYKKVTMDDVREIMDSHIEGGSPVERLIASDSEWDA